jgi:hypothetical protein
VGAVGLLFLRPASFAREWREVRGDEPHLVVYGERGRPIRVRARDAKADRSLACALGSLLRAEMSLVGPRPRPPEDVQGDEALRALFELARPGLTGSWRMLDAGSLGGPEETSLALSSLQNQSLLGDLKIVLKTIVRPRPASPAARRLR